MHPLEPRAGMLMFGVVCALLASCQRPAGEVSEDGTSSGTVRSGPQVGESVAAFQVVKVGGIDDGVKVDQKLCYR